MNYFTHACPFLEADAYFIAGTAVPDWMSVADRVVRVRARLAEPIAATHGDLRVAQVARGALQHIHDDAWFHATRGFAEITGELSRQFRDALGPDDPMKCGFLGHVVTELLLDWVLIEQRSGALDRYYERLREVDPHVVQEAVNLIARGTTERLPRFITLFIEERFLEDYADDARLLWRLNMVLRRVRLSPLPDAIVEVLANSREIVKARASELLPKGQYRIEL